MPGAPGAEEPDPMLSHLESGLSDRCRAESGDHGIPTRGSPHCGPVTRIPLSSAVGQLLIPNGRCMSRTNRAIWIGFLLVLAGWPLDAEAQACEQVTPGDRVQIEVEAPFLERLWRKKVLLTALVTNTVPRSGFFQTVRGDSLWISDTRRIPDDGGVDSGRGDGFPTERVRAIRKSCRGDPVWDGLLLGAFGGAWLAFNVDVITLVAVPFGGRPFPIAREMPEWYYIPAAMGMVIVGIIDWAAPDWIEVAMPQPAGPQTVSLGLSIRLR